MTYLNNNYEGIRIVNTKLSLIEAISSKKLRRVKKILKKGIDQNELSVCLGESIHSGLAMVKLLIQYGADINSFNSQGRTPLHNASVSGYFNIVRYLLISGANVNVKDNDGDTPLDLLYEKDIDKNSNDIIAHLSFNGGRSGWSFEPMLRLAIVKRISTLVSRKKINYPNESEEFVVDDIEAEIIFFCVLPDNVSEEEKNRWRCKVRKMILNEVNKIWRDSTP